MKIEDLSAKTPDTCRDTVHGIGTTNKKWRTVLGISSAGDRLKKFLVRLNKMRNREFLPVAEAVTEFATINQGDSWCECIKLGLYKLERARAGFENRTHTVYIRILPDGIYVGIAVNGSYELHKVVYFVPGDIKRLVEGYLYKSHKALHAACYKSVLASVPRFVEKFNIQEERKPELCAWLKAHVYEGFDIPTLFEEFGVKDISGLHVMFDIPAVKDDLFTWRELAELAGFRTPSGSKVSSAMQFIATSGLIETVVVADSLTREEAGFLERMLIDVFFPKYNRDPGADNRMFGSVMEWCRMVDGEEVIVTGQRDELYKEIGDPALSADDLDDYQWIQLACRKGYVINFSPQMPYTVYQSHMVNGRRSGGQQVLCLIGNKIKRFISTAAAKLFFVQGGGKTSTFSKKLSRKLYDAAFAFVKLKDIPQLLSGVLSSMNLENIKEFGRATKEEYMAAPKSAIKIADGTFPAYYWVDDKQKAHWWSLSPILDLNACAKDFFSRIPKTCLINSRGLDTGKIAPIETLIALA